MSGASPRIRLELDSHPECAALVRGVLGAFGDSVALDRRLLDDAATAISEACNNVVLHAYDGGPGPLTVSFAITPAGLEAVVSDRGGGLREAPGTNGSLRLGLAVIAALADRAEFSSAADVGTEVRMVFAERDRELPAPDLPLEAPPRVLAVSRR